MAKKFDLVKVNIATTGQGTVTFGSKVTGFMTPAESGAVDTDPVAYILRDGNDFEEGDGVIGGSVTTMTRTVRKSSIGGTVGTTKLTLSGTATLALMAGAAEFDDHVSFTTAQSKTAAQQAVARFNTSAALKGHLFGLTLSNNATDATNDIDIATGEAASTETNPVLMVLASTLTKRLDAAWAVGTGNGGLDTGSIANGTYHIWLIQRSDTGVVDALFSTSVSSPTMPTNYDRKRRIGSIIRASSAIRAFKQTEDHFVWVSPTLDFSSSTFSANSMFAFAISVPLGLKVLANVRGYFNNVVANTVSLVTSMDDGSTAPNTPSGNLNNVVPSTGQANGFDVWIRTDTSAQIKATGNNSSHTGTFVCASYIDTRGRHA